ncbi:MAG TPA: hypothetical protein VFV36_10305 [Candidatus Methylomirabilis sp.]|nr:hypothetical protein [Candidatus Methylomirabilis sp.]
MTQTRGTRDAETEAEAEVDAEAPTGLDPAGRDPAGRDLLEESDRITGEIDRAVEESEAVGSVLRRVLPRLSC